MRVILERIRKFIIDLKCELIELIKLNLISILDRLYEKAILLIFRLISTTEIRMQAIYKLQNEINKEEK